MADTPCTTWTKIVTIADDGTMQEWEPCNAPPEPEVPEPPVDPPAPETFYLMGEEGSPWNTETGGVWLNES